MYGRGMGHHILLSLQFIQECCKIRLLVVAGLLQLADLPVHVFDQPLVPLGQFDFRIQVIRRRSADAKEAVTVFGLINIGDDAYALLKTIQQDQPGFEIVYFKCELLNLLALMKNFFGLQRQIPLEGGFVVDVLMKEDVIEKAITKSANAGKNERGQADDLFSGAVKLFNGGTGTTQEYEGEFVCHAQS
jgi:hypothetical protein